MSDAAEEENRPEDENRSEDATVEEEKPWHRWTSWACWGNKESENYDVTGVGVFTSVVLTLVAFGVVTCGTIARFYSLEFTLAFFYLMTGLSGFATISKYTWTILIFMVTCFLSNLLSLGACANLISVLAHGTRLLNCFTRCSDSHTVVEYMLQASTATEILPSIKRKLTLEYASFVVIVTTWYMLTRS
nr:uncharacterized protein LOC129263392 [Lytechinus pictus]